MLKVHKHALIFTAGILWSGVGILLNIFAKKWFHLLTKNETIIAIVGGIILGIAISYFGFKNLAQKNIDRIDKYPTKVSIFKFQRTRMYFLIVFMIGLGIFMRKTSFVPKCILTPMYIGIGLALFLASFKYHFFLLKNRKHQ
jgi:hypothetical protein